MHNCATGLQDSITLRMRRGILLAGDLLSGVWAAARRTWTLASKNSAKMLLPTRGEPKVYTRTSVRFSVNFRSSAQMLHAPANRNVSAPRQQSWVDVQQVNWPTDMSGLHDDCRVHPQSFRIHVH